MFFHENIIVSYQYNFQYTPEQIFFKQLEMINYKFTFFFRLYDIINKARSCRKGGLCTMFKNHELEKLYNIASQRDVTHSIDAYAFILEGVEHLTDEELELIELITKMYTDVPSVCNGATDLIRSIAQFSIANIDELIRILTPYYKCMEKHKQLGQPISFLIQHKLSTTGLPEEFTKNGGRICNLRLFLVQLTSNLTLTNEYENFCIHSNVFRDLAENSHSDNADFLENVIIDLSQCESATVGYLCEHWLYTESERGRIIPNPELKSRMEYFNKLLQ